MAWISKEGLGVNSSDPSEPAVSGPAPPPPPHRQAENLGLGPPLRADATARLEGLGVGGGGDDTRAAPGERHWP